jgi:hypothetical protein
MIVFILAFSLVEERKKERKKENQRSISFSLHPKNELEKQLHPKYIYI